MGLSATSLFPAWQDATSGLPPVQIVTARELGDDTNKSVVFHDKLGRIFIGGGSLLVFDGQAWKSYPKPGDYFLTALTPAADGVIWAGSTNELGYFQEDTVGDFHFHSLLDRLPPEERNIGTIWGCGPVGRYVYFIGKNKLLRWDGKDFRITNYSSRVRLAPVRLGDELWFKHHETGIYRLTENGPELQFTANQLPVPLVMGLFRDETGLVTVTNDGLTRVNAPAPFSPKPLNDYLTQNKVSGFRQLPDGHLAISTVSGGIVLATRTGEIVRIWADASAGLPGRAVTYMTNDATGEILGTTATDFFHFPARGEVSVFNDLNGLRSRTATSLAMAKSTLYAATEDGIYRQSASTPGLAAFQPVPELAARYHHMQPWGDGLLLAKFGGVDWFDGVSVHPGYQITANMAYLIVPARAEPRSWYVAEIGGIVRLTQRPDGSFERTPFLELPDSVNNLYEDPTGRLWIGTIARGAYTYDPATRELTALTDPADGQPLQGRVEIVGNAQRILLFLAGRILQTGPQGGPLQPLSGLPAFSHSVLLPLPAGDGLFVAYRRTAGASGPLHGAGVITFAKDGAPAWRELDLPSLNAIGSIRTATFTEENQRRVLWLGGMQGILRLDYDRVPALLAPETPLIKLGGTPPISPSGEGALQYPFGNHRLHFRVFTGDYVRGKDLLLQTRLGDGNGDWSAATTRRSFDFTNLTDGVYRFEARAVNTAGQLSPPSVFTFRILPPWYRSAEAYAGYFALIVGAAFGVIRYRERRIRARNAELEALVDVRTAELRKASAAKDEFLAGISHEIRNPMNGVIGIAENFRTDRLDAESRRKFGLLRQCASHLSSLLEDILDFSKIQAGAIELDPKPFDLHELVESVAAITRSDSEKYGIPVEVAVSPAVPRRLVGDARRIRQILINFVSNALKFSGRGEVTVTVWCKEAGAGRSEVIFAVSDEGPGISAEEQARLFTRFERGAAAQKGRVPGTGLGLALCKGLAEKMGGRLWLESELGHGSCFYFSAPFPLDATPATDAPAAGATPAALRTALVVDDQEYNRIVLVDQLQALGFTVQSAQAGEAALALAGRQNFDAVFLDFNLPGISGSDVARGIRALPNATAHALILATTAFTTPEKRAQCLDAGMDGFLGKPVTRERLAMALARLLQAAPAPAPAAAPAAGSGPADRLGNLRLLARKKGVPFADELALYLAELDAEVAQLRGALERRDAEAAGRFAHMLCGRCSFIYERELEQTQRRMEDALRRGAWDEAAAIDREFGAQLADLRVRVSSSGPAAPPA